MKRSIITSNEKLVAEYFRLLAQNPDHALQLFTDDSIVYEPFSKEQGIKGKEAIRHFLRVAHMANNGLERKIEIISNDKNRIEARISFAKGDIIDGTFQFLTEDIQSQNGGTEKRIRELRIQF